MSSSCPICQVAAKVGAKRERRKDARPGELLAAALELFVEKGFAATRAEEVAKRAGVQRDLLFLYFSSKEELFKAVVRENISGRFPNGMPSLTTFREVRRTCCVTASALGGSASAPPRRRALPNS